MFNSQKINNDPEPWRGFSLMRYEASKGQSNYAVWEPRPEYDNNPNPILTTMRRWGLDPANLLWAMNHGAKKPNDKRSRELRGAAKLGRSELKPYEGEWYFHKARHVEGEGLIAAFDHARKVLTKLVNVYGIKEEQ